MGRGGGGGRGGEAAEGSRRLSCVLEIYANIVTHSRSEQGLLSCTHSSTHSFIHSFIRSFVRGVSVWGPPVRFALS